MYTVYTMSERPTLVQFQNSVTKGGESLVALGHCDPPREANDRDYDGALMKTSHLQLKITVKHISGSVQKDLTSVAMASSAP